MIAKTKEEKWMVLAGKYDEKLGQSLELEKVTDTRRFGVIQQVQDTGGGVGFAGTDLGVDHDLG